MNKMYNFIFNRVKRIIPKISDTEIIALKSGGTSIDRNIFMGKMDYKFLYSPIDKTKYNIPSDTEKNIEQLLKRTGTKPIYPNINIKDTMNYLGKNGFLSMIIDKKYGGNRLSIETQSYILSKISSYNPSLGVVTMVPNSLGPAELLQDLNHRPIIFIRFNPDDYLIKDKKISSCWGVNKKGLCVIKKSKEIEWLERLNTLSSQIDYWINPLNKTNKTVEIIQLFYDE